MNKLSQLLQSIDYFYKKAMQSYRLVSLGAPPDYSGGWSSPDDPEEDETGLYGEIVDTARSLEDENLSDPLLLIAEMYKKALEIDNGYNFINKGISSFITIQLDNERDLEQQRVLDLLNKVSKDLRDRASASGAYGGDSVQALQELKEVERRFNASEPAEVSTDELIGTDTTELEPEADKPTKPGDEEEPSEAPEKGFEEGEVQVDLTGGARNKEQNRGIGIQDKKQPKAWVESYKNEISRYQAELQDEKDPSITQQKTKIIGIMGQLIDLYEDQDNEIQKYRDEKVQATLETIEASISDLKKQVRDTKLSIRNKSLTDGLGTLEQHKAKAKTDREKFLLDQKIQLYKNMLSGEIGRRQETQLRKRFIKELEQGRTGTLNKETGKIDFSVILKKIEDAAKGKRTRKEYNVKEWENQLALLKSGTFKGMILEFSKKILNHKASVKKDVVTDALKLVQAARYSELKPYIDAANAAKKSKDKSAIDAAAAALNEAMNKKKVNSEAELDPFVKASFDRTEQFRQLRKMFIDLEEKSSAENVGNLTDAIAITVGAAKDLISQHKGQKYTGSLIGFTEDLVKFLEEGLKS